MASLGARLGSWILVLVVLWLGVVALVWVFQRRLVYLPFPRSLEPIELVLPGAEAFTTTAEGSRLGGWWLPGSTGVSFLVFNGNAGNRSHRAELAQSIAGAGHSVLLFDYRGYGDSQGSPTETGLIADAVAVRRYAIDELGADPARLVYFGESLGAAVAIALGVEHPPAALVLRSPFSSLADVGRRHYPFLPVRLLLRDRYPSIERVGRVRAPLLVVAGEADSIVSVDSSRALYQAAREPKEWILVEGADHNDWRLTAGPALIESVLEFVGRWVE